MIERRRLRDALGDLVEDKHLLDDIGLTLDDIGRTQEQALYDARKRFWR